MGKSVKEGDKRLGNQFWKLRSKHGRDKLFATPELLWDSACEYFQWCDDNPLKEEKAFHYQGVITKDDTNKMRAYTITALCLYLNCNTQYFNNFEANNKDSKDFNVITTRIRETIYSQKFVGAAADLLNPNIIARELGLIDKTDLTTGGDKIKQPIPLVLQDGRTYEDLKKDLTPE